MRIAIVHSRYRTGPASGENRVVSDEQELLRSAGHEVISWEPTLAKGASGIGTAIRTVWNAKAAARVRDSLNAANVDVLHVHNLFPNLSPSILRVALAARVPVVMTLHNFRLSCLAATLLRDDMPCTVCVGKVPWRGVKHRCYRSSFGASAALAGSLTLHRSLGSFNGIVLFDAVSGFVADTLVQGGLDASRVRIRRHFAWPVPRRQGPGSYFLVLGRLSSEKGFDVVVRGWNQRERLLVAGDGPEKDRLMSLASPGVQFLGRVDPDSVPALLARCRALLMPSRAETAGRAAIEAMAAGVPVIGHRIGGLPEHVAHGESGLLVESRTPGEWASALHRIQDDALSIKLGNGAFSRWQTEFSPEVALPRLEALYADALGLAPWSRDT